MGGWQLRGGPSGPEPWTPSMRSGIDLGVGAETAARVGTSNLTAAWMHRTGRVGEGSLQAGVAG